MDKPLIGVTACSGARPRGVESCDTQTVDDRYLLAVIEGAGGVPVVIPAFGDRVAAAEWIDRLDGLLLTGSLRPASQGSSATRFPRAGVQIQ